MVRFVAGTVILALAGIGIGAGIFVWGLGGTPQVAVMNGPQDVIDDELADALRTQLTFVTEDSDIKAVVIRVNSPGGFADRSEEALGGQLHKIITEELSRSGKIIDRYRWLPLRGRIAFALKLLGEHLQKPHTYWRRHGSDRFLGNPNQH